MLIKCPGCPWTPPKQTAGEDIIWYGYRKWRALANHMADAHFRQLALTYRHRVAVKEGKAKLSETRFPGKRTRAA